MTKRELADKIESGYKKHNLAFTSVRFYNTQINAACPMFAAFADNFSNVKDAHLSLKDAIENGYAYLSIAEAVGIDADLAWEVGYFAMEKGKMYVLNWLREE